LNGMSPQFIRNCPPGCSCQSIVFRDAGSVSQIVSLDPAPARLRSVSGTAILQNGALTLKTLHPSRVVRQLIPLVRRFCFTMRAFQFASSIREFRLARKENVQTGFIDNGVIKLLFAIAHSSCHVATGSPNSLRAALLSSTLLVGPGMYG
jgi:hypothetical protein